MAKTKSILKFWSFPFYFGAVLGKNGRLSGSTSHSLVRLIFLVGLGEFEKNSELISNLLDAFEPPYDH